MWKLLKALLPKPPTRDERFWRLVSRDLESDAKLFADGLELANRRSAGSWATMLVECEIVALRACVVCGPLSDGHQADAEALIRAFEERFREWLVQKHSPALNSYSIFSRKPLAEVLHELSGRWHIYRDFTLQVEKVSAESLGGFIALFWIRCIRGYTNQDLGAYDPIGDAIIDRFVPQYFSAQLDLAHAATSKKRAEQIAAKEPDSKFRAGQVWGFKTPADQPNAQLTVLKVENGGQVGTIVHIRLSDVSYGDGQTTISHLPFAEAAVEQSVTTLERESGPVPDFAEGYRIWREAFDAGEGGIFTIPVAEAFEAVTGAVRNRK